MEHRPGSRFVLLAILTAALALSFINGCGGREAEQDSAAVSDDDWGEPGGRWHSGDWMEIPLDAEGDLTQEQREEFQRLLSIGYLAGNDPVPSNSGVIVYDGSKAWYGFNFYTSGHLAGAILMDMKGNILHEWKMDFVDAWNAMPGQERPRSVKSGGFWRRAHLFENGDVIGIYDWIGIVKIDKDSNLIWARFAGFHHDLDVFPDGRIITLVRKARIVPRIHSELPILEDFVVVLDADGNELERVSVLEAIEKSDHTHLLDRLAPHGDIFHTNTVEILDGRLASKIPGFDAGNVLITIRELGLIAVIDLDAGKVVWSFDGRWRKPHQATVLDNGNIMIFDNRGNYGRTQIIEFDPVTLEGVWFHRGVEPDDFYSDQCGSNQRLPNGNTLITESDRGKVFEITPDGETVWKYMNTARARKQNKGEFVYIASLFDVLRLPAVFPTDWADRPESGQIVP